MKTLLDTVVLSEARKADGHARVREQISRAGPDDLYVSVISIGELSFGIARLAAGAKRTELESWLAQTEQHFVDRILPIDRDIAQLWGEITAKAARAGRTLHAADGLIAATALHYGLRLMTRNVKHFEGFGVALVNPWES